MNEFKTQIITIISLVLIGIFKNELRSYIIGLIIFFGKEYNEGDFVLLNSEIAKIEKIGLRYIRFLILKRKTYQYVNNDRLKYINIEFIPKHLIDKLIKKEKENVKKND